MRRLSPKAAQFLTPNQLAAFRDYLNGIEEMNQMLKLSPTPH